MSLTSIDLGLRDTLRDQRRRQEFFKAITQDEIASQIRALRKKRELTQSTFAKLAEMKQSAVSRIEQADYSSWTLTTLFRVAAALDARWRIILEPSEDAIAELENMETTTIIQFGGQAAKNFVEEQTAGTRTPELHLRSTLHSASPSSNEATAGSALDRLNSNAGRHGVALRQILPIHVP